MGTIRPDAQSVLRRRNSISSTVVPTKLDLPLKTQASSFPFTNGNKSSYPTVDFELVSLRSQPYTSLKDLMPSPAAAVQSPTVTQSGYEISIRNRLVKQAAWAYLQPMAASPDSSGQHFFRRMWVRFSSEYLRNPVNSCLSFINRNVIATITRAFDRILGALWVRKNRGR